MEKLEFKLYSAFENREWKKACNILDCEGELLRQLLSKNSEHLQHAIVRNAPEEVIVLLISPHIINMPSRYGHTSLHAALSWEKRWDLVPVLLQHGADVDVCDVWDRTPLHLAVRCDTPKDIFSQLISYQNVNMQDVNDATALHLAMKWERWDLVPVLLQHGADVNLRDKWTQTPLHLAVEHGAPADIISQLISPHNINMRRCRSVGYHTALHLAVNKERWDLVPVLLQHGSDVNLLGLWNRTPLHWAAWCGAPADIIPKLISPHNINMQDYDGSTALHEAVRVKMWDLVPILIQYGADPSLLDSPQPQQPLLLSLQDVCIKTIRSNMPVKTDAAYEGLGLPVILANAAKLKHQADAIVSRGRGK